MTRHLSASDVTCRVYASAKYTESFRLISRKYGYFLPPVLVGRGSKSEKHPTTPSYAIPFVFAMSAFSDLEPGAFPVLVKCNFMDEVVLQVSRCMSHQRSLPPRPCTTIRTDHTCKRTWHFTAAMGDDSNHRESCLSFRVLRPGLLCFSTTNASPDVPARTSGTLWSSVRRGGQWRREN